MFTICFFLEANLLSSDDSIWSHINKAYNSDAGSVEKKGTTEQFKAILPNSSGMTVILSIEFV